MRKVDEIAPINLKVLHVILQLAHVIWREVTHGLEFNIYNKVIIKRYSRSLCKTLEVFACAGANLVRASDLLDPAVSSLP
jgi:hypothetical protein